MSRGAYLECGLAIGVMTFVCAFLAMLVALLVLHLRLPASDSARDVPFVLFLADPLLLMVAVPVTLVVALLAFPTAFFLLVRTQLNRSIPIALVSTLIGTALGGFLIPILGSVLGGLICGEFAMLWCSFRLREEVAAGCRPPPPS
jgi:hypothetical protein